MPRITKKKIGSVYLKFMRTENKWRASWWDPKAKKHHRFRLNATNYREALKQCREINRQLAQDSGFLPRSEQSPYHFTVKDALLKAITNTRAGDHQIKRYVSDANVFLDWLASRHPKISHWNELRPEILEQYIQWLDREDYAYDTIRARAQVLRMTSRFLVHNYFDLYRDIAIGLKVTRKRPVRVQALSIDELAALLPFAKEHAPETYACMVLQSMAGLRILEALHLRDQDVNWQAGTIEITETKHHRPKNLYSFRTIPVAPQVIEALQFERMRTKVKSAEGYILNHSRGGPHDRNNIGRRIREVFRHLAQERDHLNFARLRPHELRATFITLARQAGSEERELKRYIGHSPRDIMGMHYEAVSAEALRRGVVDVFLGAYGEKLNAEKTSQYCTIAAQVIDEVEPKEAVS